MCCDCMTYLTTSQVAADNLYKTAWGKSWPSATQKTLLKSTVLGVTAATPSANDIMDVDPSSLVPIASDMNSDLHLDVYDITYTCLGDIEILYDALLPPSPFPPVLVPLAEYESFIGILTEQEKTANTRCSAAVLGQPGIGKTTFLLYLLLYRLERKLPTAAQFNAEHYIIFDDEGARVHNLNEEDPHLKNCWALADSNVAVTHPCANFRTDAWFVIQATSPKLERWKEWLKQKEGQKVIMDLPTTMEIVAIANECGYTPSLAYSYVGKWGPSIRTVLNLCKLGDDEEASLDETVIQAARDVCANPTLISIVRGMVVAEKPSATYFTLLFIRPRLKDDGKRNRMVAHVFTPTDYLTDILEQSVRRLTNSKRLELFEVYRSHSYTRTAAGWALEMQMHH
ncbi:hypothetical protein C8Q80DRAFT_173093 [Daedaleopsis nitida]|nr:hypothetical protein C8Q80DRAFT_173093 [Daedaleopsis nitida]